MNVNAAKLRLIFFHTCPGSSICEPMTRCIAGFSETKWDANIITEKIQYRIVGFHRMNTSLAV
jgi:hypothetical protein